MSTRAGSDALTGVPIKAKMLPARSLAQMRNPALVAAISRPRARQIPPPIFGGLSPVKRAWLSDGDLGTAQTIDKIRKLVHDGMTDQFVNRWAIWIVRGSGVPQFDFDGEQRGIFAWVMNSIRFVRDVFNIETIRSAREILTVQAGDCDCINAVLLPSLLMTIGNNVRLVTIATDPQRPQEFTHIYCEVQGQDGSWIPIDSARIAAKFGRGPNHWFRMRRWSLTDNSYEDVQSGQGAARSNFVDLWGMQRLGLSGYFRNLRGYLGDTATDIAALLAAGGNTAAQLINAANGNTAVPLASSASFLPQGTLVASSVPGGLATSATGTFPSWLIFLALGVGVFMFAKGSH